MSLVVQKFGGSSVADAAAMKRVAERICLYAKAGHQVVVVVSAMGDTTDELIDLAGEISPNPPPREMDMLITAGERMSMAVLSMALNEVGVTARAYTGSQAGLITDNDHGKAQIRNVTPARIKEAVEDGAVAIVAGFQGVSHDSKEITTLGRGVSDVTAVALAAALDADVCEIYSDVDGVFTADPRIAPSAHGVPLHVRSAYSGRLGTIVAEDLEREIPIDPDVTIRTADVVRRDAADPTKELPMDDFAAPGLEAPIISGVAHDSSEGKITVVEVPDVPGRAALLFDVVAGSGANIDMIVQNSSTVDETVAISLTVPEDDAAAALDAIEKAKEAIGYSEVRYNPDIGKVSLVGAGMKSSPGVSATLFQALGEGGINIDMISTSEIRISVVTEEARLDDAVRAIHSAFGLDAEQTEAVVYGGTGR